MEGRGAQARVGQSASAAYDRTREANSYDRLSSLQTRSLRWFVSGINDTRPYPATAVHYFGLGSQLATFAITVAYPGTVMTLGRIWLEYARGLQVPHIFGVVHHPSLPVD